MLESWQVVMRCGARLVLVGGLVMYSALASALGLGEITVRSALNQPLQADIALVDAVGLEEGDLSVSLATADEFSRAGVERVFFLNDLKFTPILRGNRNVIRVTSSKPVDEPFLDFLVQLNQPNGRLLREYTVLIDPPGSPGILPADNVPLSSAGNSPFPRVEPAKPAAPLAKKPVAQGKPEQPATPTVDRAAEQLAASVLQNQQLQKNLDELNSKLQAQDEQLAAHQQQVIELQTRLAEVRQAPPIGPAAPVAVKPVPVVPQEPEAADWPLILGVLALVALLLLAAYIRHKRQSGKTLMPLQAASLSPQEPAFESSEPALGQASALQPAPLHQEETPAGDVLEGVGIYMAYGRYSEAAGLLRDALAKDPQRTDLAVQLLEVLGKQGDVTAYEAQENSLREGGFDAGQLQEIRDRYPKLNGAPRVSVVAPVAIPVAPPIAPVDDFQLNLDELSMESSWDLISPFENGTPAGDPPKPEEPAFDSDMQMLPDVFEMPEESALEEPQLEWVAEPEAQALNDAFLDEFSDSAHSFELEPLILEPDAPANAGKLEQAQTCIDDGDLDSAIELLNELLEEGDEPLRQTARTLLAGIR